MQNLQKSVFHTHPILKSSIIKKHNGAEIFPSINQYVGTATDQFQVHPEVKVGKLEKTIFHKYVFGHYWQFKSDTLCIKSFEGNNHNYACMKTKLTWTLLELYRSTSIFGSMLIHALEL